MQGNFNIQISADASSGIAAANATADALKKAADATSKIADESERYQQVLEQMAQKQATVRQVSAEDVAMTERASARKKDLAERAAYAASVQEELAGSIATVTKEQAEEIIGTEKAVNSKRQLAEVIKGLGREFPVLGAVGRIALNPIVAAVTLAAMGFRKLKGDIEHLNAALSTPEFEGYAAVVAAQRKAAQDAAIAVEAHAAAVERLARAESTASEAAERTMTVFKAQMTAEDRLDQARKNVELSRAHGEADPVKRAAKELEIEERYASRKLQREERTRNFERTEQYRKLANEEIAAQMAGSALEKALERQKSLKSEAEITEQIRIEKANLAKTDEDLQAKQERRYGLLQIPWALRSTAQEHEIGYLGQQIEQGGAVRSQQARLVGRLEAAAPGRIAAARAASGAVQALEQTQMGAIQRAEGIRGMLPTQEAVWSTEARASRGVAAMETLSRTQGALNEGRTQEAQLARSIHQGIVQRNSETEAMIRSLDLQQNVNDALEQRLRKLERQAANLR